MTVGRMLAILLVLGTILTTVFTFSGYLDSFGAIAAHLVLAVGCAFFWVSIGKGRRTGHMVAGLCFLIFFPYFGVLASAVLCLWSLFNPPPEDGQGELGEDEQRIFDIRDRLMRPKAQESTEESFLPAVTMLESPDLEDRRSAIEVLAKIGGPQQIPHLQKCLDDPEREVYQLAHAKLTALHERYTDAINQGQKDSRKEELDSVIAYLNSGLLGDATLAFYRQKAITLGGQLLREAPKDPQLLTLLGNLYLDGKKYQDAKLAFESSLKLDDSIESRWGLVRISYQARDYSAFLEHLGELRGLASATVPGTREITDVVTWWFGEANSIGELT